MTTCYRVFLATLMTTLCASVCSGMEPVGIDSLIHLERLPFLKPGVTVHYEGSIDKAGGNADWDWWLYQEGEEWVIFDVEGPGCLYNFVQHRYPTSPEPTFRFYFDGETQPRFEIRQSEFGKKAPFLEPLSAIYQGPDDNGRGPIWVIRSFVPMPFARSCRITSSVQLKGFDKAKQEGGWGHVIYHTYSTSEGITTFSGNENYEDLLNLWKRSGENPLPFKNMELIKTTSGIEPGASGMLFERSGQAALGGIEVKIEPFTPDRLKDLWIRATWDGHQTPDIECPIGAFFGNEFGLHDMCFMTHGMESSGRMYSYSPMPFWRSARLEIINKGKIPVNLTSAVQIIHPSEFTYPEGSCGYFRTSAYYPQTPVTPGKDSLIASIRGRGHLVAGLVSGYSVDNKTVSCEGDVRVHIDGERTPQVESDGSESWSCYGWGFPTPPQSNPASGYDGSGPPLYTFSMTRVLMGDWYPFERSLQFGIEAGGKNDWPMAHSGVVSYYGLDQPSLRLTDVVDVGDKRSEFGHDYHVTGQTWTGPLESFYEGDDDEIPLRDKAGRAFTGASDFRVRIDPANRGVRLRLRCDQSKGRQRAKVFVDGKPITERHWYIADRNPMKQWLDTDFEIPESYTKGKELIRIRIENAGLKGGSEWNEFRYLVFSYGSASNVEVKPAR